MPDALLTKATRALGTARLALHDGDCEGAVNRAYYGMFHAARAALIARGADRTRAGRTHSTLIAEFSLAFVKSGHVGVHLGRWLNWVEGIRLTADYKAEPFADEPVARLVLERATEFCSAVHPLIRRETTP